MTWQRSPFHFMRMILVEIGGDVAVLAFSFSEIGVKLRGSEYDDTTWSARSWTSYTMQRVSCAVMRAVAWEAAQTARPHKRAEGRLTHGPVEPCSSGPGRPWCCSVSCAYHPRDRSCGHSLCGFASGLVFMSRPGDETVFLHRIGGSLPHQSSPKT